MTLEILNRIVTFDTSLDSESKLRLAKVGKGLRLALCLRTSLLYAGILVQLIEE